MGPAILVIGDLLIDRTYYTKVPKLSPEAPVPVAALQGDPVDTPGGAGLGAAFSASEGIPTIFACHCSPTKAKWLEDKFGIQKVISSADEDVINISKTRFIDLDSGYHLIRVDNDQLVVPPFEDSEYSDREWLDEIEEVVQTGTIGIIAILDYRKGLLGPQYRVDRLLQISRKHGIPIYVDSRTEDIEKFVTVDVLKLNEKEYAAACGRFDVSSPIYLMLQLNVTNMIVTKGAKGADLYMFSNETRLVTKRSHRPEKLSGSPDVTGCGDVLDISFCYNWMIEGLSPIEALKAASDRATEFAYEPIETRIKCR